jgi:hypothetical protein
MNKNTKQTCAYLYADGHAVIIYEQTVKLGGTTTDIEYAVIHEEYCHAHLGFKGRLCFGRCTAIAMLDLAKRATAIRASVPTTENGSENTKRMGIAIGSLSFEFSNGGHLYFNSMPDIISGQFTYQPETDEAFDPEAMFWGNVKVAEVKRVKDRAANKIAA